MDDFQDVNETFKNFFTPDTYPARSFFQVFKLPKNALDMIDAVATISFGEDYVEVANLRNITSINYYITCSIMVADTNNFTPVSETVKSFFSDDTCPSLTIFQLSGFPMKAVYRCEQPLDMCVIALETTKVVPGGARAKAEQAMSNIEEILTSAASSFKHAINFDIMVVKMDNFLDINETFKDFVTPDTCPARSFFQVVKLPTMHSS
ncbi:hypothetical protein niasHT_038459 [Heterodera trifolii]|uniref:Uncharacterized protein n=1 Tax=Heterodera trifolii TaxID=157864 RepID=A0ABD2IS74_9BILA